MRFALASLLLLIPSAIAQTPSSPPVILVNGYQTPPCDSLTPEATFGELGQRLTELGREVIFFNNCTVPPVSTVRPTIEELGAALGSRIAGLSASQVDIVAHSMGGLIVRAYLSGKQNAPGVFQPPAQHKVRKAVFLGTPNFGPGYASILAVAGRNDPQVQELLPGSQFLLDLATWNQGGDDLRGVDAVAVAGNSASLSNVAASSDGLVSIQSASLSFAGVTEDRVRLIPYCHTEYGALALVAATCAKPPYLADVDSQDHLSFRIIRSFLTGSDEWKTIGSTISNDASAKAYGGVLVSWRDKDDNPVTGLGAASVGTTQFQVGSAYFYGEYVPVGTANLALASSSTQTTAPLTVKGGLYSVAVVKPGPRATAVLPSAGAVKVKAVAPGMFVSIYGEQLANGSEAATAVPFPTTLAGTQVLNGTQPLALHYAGTGQINAVIPENASGALRLEVKAATGSNKLNVLVEPAVPAIFTQAQSGSGPASARDALTNGVITAQAPAKEGDIVSLYLTGLGATETRDGLQWAKIVPKVFVGGLEAQISYAGRAPGYPGLDQINLTIPVGVPKGESTEIRVESNGRVSNLAVLPTT